MSALSEAERQVVFECLRASLAGPFFPDWEFPTLFGIARSDLARLVDAWPQLDEDAEHVGLAIRNSMTNLIGYPHHRERDWPRFVSVPPQEVERIYLKWAVRER